MQLKAPATLIQTSFNTAETECRTIKNNDNNAYWEWDDTQLEGWMEDIKFYSVCCWALTLNECTKHQSNDHFPSFKSERLVAPLTTPPLMGLRILLLALKCITNVINVIWDTQAWHVCLETNMDRLEPCNRQWEDQLTWDQFSFENVIIVQEAGSRRSSDTRFRCYYDDRWITKMSV